MFAAGKFSSMMFWTGVAGAEHPDAMSVIDADSGAGCPAPGVTAGESTGSTCQDDRHIYGSVLTCYRGALRDEGRVRRVRAVGHPHLRVHQAAMKTVAHLRRLVGESGLPSGG
jgi:hypothetical protein